MTNLTSVGITAGVPTSGTGTVSTIDNLIAVGMPISNGTTTAAIKAASTAPVATDPGLVVSISPNSVNANGQATMANSAPVVIASNQTAVPVSFTQAALPAGSANIGSVELLDAAGTNKATIKAASTAPVTSTDTAMVVGLRPDSPGIVALGQTTKSASVPVTIASDQALTVAQTSSYPSGATVVVATSGSVAASTATATLAGTSGKTTYISGFSVTGSGATVGTVVNVTVTNLIGSVTFTYPVAAVAGVLGMNTPLIVSFPNPIPASASNTSIVVSCPSLGTGNTNNAVNVFGYQL